MKELLISVAMLAALMAYAWYERRPSMRRAHRKDEREKLGQGQAWIPPARVRGMPRRRISRAGNVPIGKAR